MRRVLFGSSSERSHNRKTNHKVDVIAGDDNGAAYKYFRNQKYQDLYHSSVAIMQHEVKEGHPFEDRLCTDYYHNNHSLHISS